jgi:hypothetical protein
MAMPPGDLFQFSLLSIIQPGMGKSHNLFLKIFNGLVQSATLSAATT